MRRCTLRCPTSIAAVVAATLCLPVSTLAQDADPTADASADESVLSEVIVTGTARAQRRFDASYAVNSLTGDDIRKLAPKNYADLLGNVPGIHVEATGGEVQNITRLRGMPSDRGYL